MVLFERHAQWFPTQNHYILNQLKKSWILLPTLLSRHKHYVSRLNKIASGKGKQFNCLDFLYLVEKK
jgi:hypothetical protein